MRTINLGMLLVQLDFLLFQGKSTVNLENENLIDFLFTFTIFYNNKMFEFKNLIIEN